MKTLRDKIRIMQAYEFDDAVIEFKTRENTKWEIVIGTPAFNWQHCDYRIKPVEPRVFYACEHENGNINKVYATEGEMANNERSYLNNGAKAIKLQEVLE